MATGRTRQRLAGAPHPRLGSRAAKGPFQKYNYGITEFNVAYAIVAGILDETKVDAQLLEYLQRHIAFYRDRLRESDDSNSPLFSKEIKPR